MRNQTIFELDTDDNKSKYCSSSKDILKSVKNLWKSPSKRKQSSKSAATDFLSKISNRSKISKTLSFVKQNKFWKNDKFHGFKTEYHKHFSNKLTPADVDDSWEKLDFMVLLLKQEIEDILFLKNPLEFLGFSLWPWKF